MSTFTDKIVDSTYLRRQEWRTIACTSLCLLLWACETNNSSPPPHLQEPPHSPQAMSAEELIEIRRKAGFKDSTDLLSESAKLREKDARQYIKDRMPEYRQLLADLQQSVQSIAEGAQQWPNARNPQQAFERWNRQYTRKIQKLTATYYALTAQESQGGATQVLLGRSFHAWENLSNDLSPDISQKARFNSLLQEINQGFAAVEQAFDDIDQDERLIVDRFYQPRQKKPAKSPK